MDGQVASEARPLRERVALAMGWRHDPAWRGVGTWIAPDGKMYQSPPELTTDFALSLPGPNIIVRRQIVGPHWCAGVFMSVSGDGLTWKIQPGTYREGHTAADAIALVWLDYMADLSARQAPTVQLDTSPKTE